MSFLRVVKIFFISGLFCIGSFFILINVPVVQKKIFSEVCDAFYRKNNFIIQYEDVFVKYFHIVCIKNLKVFAKDSSKNLLNVSYLRLKLDPFSLFFRRVLCFSDIDIEKVDVDFLSFVKDDGKGDGRIPNFLSFFSVEVNNLKIKKSLFKITKSFFLKDVSVVVKKCFLSNKSFSADIEDGSFFFNEEQCNSFSVGFSFFLKKKVLSIDRLSFVSSYGVFDGKINVEDLSRLLKKDFDSLDISIAVNKLLLSVDKIKKINMSHYFSNKNVFISLSGDFFLKNKSVFLKNFSAEYLNSFFDFNMEIWNVFDYEKIKYSMRCDKLFLDFNNFIFPFNDLLKKNINECSFGSKPFSLRGDFFNCLVDVDFNTSFGLLKATTKIQNQPFKNNFFRLKKIHTDGVLSDNVFSFLPCFKNKKTRFVADLDMLSKDFSFILNLDKCTYKEETFKNISLSCQGNGVEWSGKVSSKDDILSTSVSLKSSHEAIDMQGSFAMKRFPLALQNVCGNKLKNVKTDIHSVFTRGENGFSLLGYFSNLSFFYLDDFYFEENFSFNFCLQDGLSFFDFKSGFVDAETKNVPWKVVESFSEMVRGKNNFCLCKDVFSSPFSIKIKKPFFSFFSILKKVSMSAFSLCGEFRNDVVWSCFLKVFLLENTVTKNIEINPFNLDLSIVKKNNEGCDVFIKSDNLVFNKRFFSFKINALCSRDKKINGSLEYCEKNKEKVNFIFNVNKESIFWFLSFSSPFFSGKVGFNSNFCFVDNCVLKNSNGKEIFSFCGNIDFLNRRVEKIKMFCENINIGFFSLFLKKTIVGVLSCDISSDGGIINVRELIYDNIFYGDIHAEIKKEKDVFSVVGDLFDEKNICSVSGKYFENKMMDLKIVLNDVGLKKINPLVSKVMFVGGGFVSGEFFLKGSFLSPQFCGSGKVTAANVLFYDTGTFCQDISASVVCSGDNKIKFDDVRAYDNNKSLLRGNGFFEFVSLTNIKIKFSCIFNNFELLNIRLENNGFCGGNGFFDGKVDVSFFDKKLEVVCDVKCNKSSFCVVLSASDDGFRNFISVFETKTAFFKKKDKKWNDTGVFLSGCVDLLEGARFSVQLNQYVKITTNGCGKINFSTDCKSLFDFRGDYKIKSGVFFVNFYDIISQSFYLRSGGGCEFRGPLSSIRLNVVAESEIESFSHKGINQTVDVVIVVVGPVLNFDLKYSVVSKLGEVFFASQNLNMKNFGNSDSVYLKKFFSIFFYKTLDTNSTYSALLTTQINGFFNDFLNKKLGDKNFKLTVDFSDFFNKNIWYRRLKYDFFYKITDKTFFYKNGFLDGVNSIFDNISLRHMFVPGVFGSVTFLPRIGLGDKTKGIISVGLFFNKDFNI
ncbi:MAG: translocation/assembly module TamB domain-containing protein [Cytophagales bacterium]|nr:translocation/assembly module TamB domain-containing protein [Cytophagales bacterium]